jgi:DNA-binding NtrC family response regulator
MTEGDRLDGTTMRDAGEPLPSDELVLLAVKRDGTARLYPLPKSGATVIGRGPECAVRVLERGVSREHAVIHAGGRLAVEDLGSTNGTILRGKPLTPHAPESLRPGDSFTLGGILMSVQRAPESSAGREGMGFPVTPSASMSRVLALAATIAAGGISIVILGETGVGKDFLANQIHALSPRSSRPFLRLNCAALSEALFESELFGHEKGAFTGAVAAKRGLIEAADGGTVLLDEVGELSAAAQAKLLRVLEQREFFRVGAVTARKVDVRFLAATNRNLESEVARGRFRQDLYFRLAGAVVSVPSLRQRREEIVPFAEYLLREIAQAAAQPTPEIAPEAAAWLASQPWPGNLRELRNTMERAMLLCKGGIVSLEHVLDSAGPASLGDERDRIEAALASFGGNQTQAAKALSISRNTLVARMERYGLTRPRRPGRPER